MIPETQNLSIKSKDQIKLRKEIDEPKKQLEELKTNELKENKKDNIIK